MSFEGEDDWGSTAVPAESEVAVKPLFVLTGADGEDVSCGSA